MRAYAMAVQPPQGPVYLSLPLNDWEEIALGEAVVRETCTRVAPDPERLKLFAEKLNAAKRPALILGADLDRAGAWRDVIALAEAANCAVFAAPASERCSFPEDHRLYAGNLPFGIAPLSAKLSGYDLAFVIGAPVFRYYPYVPGSYLPEGCSLLHITNDAEEAARAPVGDSLVGDVRLAVQALLQSVKQGGRDAWTAPTPQHEAPSRGEGRMTADELFAAVARVRDPEAVIVEESPSNLALLHKHLPITQPSGFFTMASGGLGFGLPASVGVALAERSTGRHRPVPLSATDHFSTACSPCGPRLSIKLGRS